MIESIKVVLTIHEISAASYVGCRRRLYGIHKNLEHKYGMTPENAWTVDIEGAMAEMAVAKYLNLYWEGKVGVGEGDVGPIEVRSSIPTDEKRRLILHPDDKDEKIFVLVRGHAPYLYIRGWAQAREGKLKKYWWNPFPAKPERAAFFVSNGILQDPATLRDAVAALGDY